ASWQTFDVAGTDGLETGDYDGAVFDGRYVYFTPLSTGNVLRYDTHAEFGDHGSWSAYDIKPLGMELAVGALFDGRYVYFAPYGETTAVIRYDTQGGFRDPASWTAYEFGRTTGMTTRGFDGGLFDGRYVYFIPYYDGVGVFHGVTLRYDTTGGFDDPGAWTAHDAGRTDGLLTAGFNGGATDGRYLYCAPWNDGSAYPNAIVGNGRVLRYDTVGRQGSFSLRFADCGHNGGLCGAVPGARFIINTETGPRSVAANRVPRAGRQALAGVYDGRLLRLYQDGELVNEQAASGRLVTTGTELSVGQMFRGQGRFRGTIQRVRISRVARDARWLKAHAGATAR
ncbi:hypothetical protein HQ590_03940, partial [bacterium]|nr:hypothetical protein [bacterium]